MSDRRFTRHPLSSLCGDMDAESFKALVGDIREQGQLEPVDLVGDEVLDGWHRHQACLLLGRETKTRVLPEGLEPVEYVLGKNAHRRHMTAEQRAAVVMLAADWMPDHRPAGTKKGDTVSPLSNEAAAERAGGEQTNDSEGEGADSGRAREGSGDGIRNAPFTGGQGEESRCGGGAEGLPGSGGRQAEGEVESLTVETRRPD